MHPEVGLALRLARIAVGKSQWQVAAKVGIHPSLLNLVEAGKRVPEVALVQALLRELSQGNGPAASPLVALVLTEAHRIAAESQEEQATDSLSPSSLSEKGQIH